MSRKPRDSNRARKYSIGAKIVTVVAFLLVATTGIGQLVVSNMRAINANTVDIATSSSPSVRALGDLRYAVVINRTIVREHISAETLEDKLKVEEAFASSRSPAKRSA
jgi:methyl-accepting chemotaxis protein